MQLLPTIIDSPVSDGRATLRYELATLTFRKETYDIAEHFYQDDATDYRFTTEAVDNLNLTQVYNQHRTRRGIPFPEQIRALREQYQLSAAKMSLILDFGPNQFRKYEEGEMPSDSNAAHMLTARDPRVFRQLVERKRTELPATEYSRLLHRLREMELAGSAPWDCNNADAPFLPATLTNPHAIPDAFNGFTPPSAEKFAQMVLYFYGELDYLYQVKLLKLLFYADFLHYRSTGRSISGYRYQALPHGPVPVHYELHLGALVSSGLLTRSIDSKYTRSSDGGPVIKYTPAKPANLDVFSPSERTTLESVFKRLGFRKSKEVEDLSHEEQAWLDNQSGYGLINYQQYAFDLKDV